MWTIVNLASHKDPTCRVFSEQVTLLYVNKG
jgi:hypothetical protein